MAELKTKINDASVPDFLNKVSDESTRADCFAILKMMQQVTKTEPKMWGSSIVGFGHVHYAYASGREGDWFSIGFSPRKANLTLYSMGGFNENDLQKLGKFKMGKGCLYIKSLKDVDVKVLKSLLKNAVKAAKSR